MTDWSEIVEKSTDPCLVALREDDSVSLRAQIAAGRSLVEKFHADRTFLHIAAELGATKCVEVLLEQGMDIEALLSFGGDSALMQAVSYGKTETARLLLKKGARIRYMFTPPDTAEIRSRMREDYRKLFAEANGNIRATLPLDIPDQTNELADQLMEVSLSAREVYALQLCRDFETLRLLVDEYGCDVNHHDGAGYWPLKLFAEQGDAPAIKFLLSHGAIPEFTSTGDTALHAAISGSFVECARILLEDGANPNQQDVDGNVPMYRVNSHEALDLLLEFGADPNICDQAGFKPSYFVNEPSVKARLLDLEKTI